MEKIEKIGPVVSQKDEIQIKEPPYQSRLKETYYISTTISPKSHTHIYYYINKFLPSYV